MVKPQKVVKIVPTKKSTGAPRKRLPVWNARTSIIDSDEQALELLGRVGQTMIARYRTEVNEKKGFIDQDFQRDFAFTF